MAIRTLPSVTDAALPGGVARATIPQPAFRPKFTEAAVAEPKMLAAELQRFERAHFDADWAARAHPMQGPATVLNVPFTSGQVTYIPHSFAGAVNWLVVGWRGAVAGANLYESATAGDQTDSRLALKASTTGTGDLLIWRRP